MTAINIDSTYGVIIIQDLQAVFVDENYARIYGYDSAAQLLASIDSFLDLIEPELHEVAKQNYRDTISGNMIPRGHTFTNIDRNGREFTVFSVDHVIDWQGKPALQVTVMDLSALVEANEKLHENHQNYRNLILHSNQAIIVHRNFIPLLVNQSWVDAMHAESIDFVLAQKSLLDRFPSETQDLVKQRYQDIIFAKVTQTDDLIIESICYDQQKRFFKVQDNVIDWGGSPALQVVLEDVTERILLERELLYKATHDQLSNLLNRSAIYEWLQKNNRPGEAMACLLIDLDNFKPINDNYGHHKGDQVIGYFSRILKETLAEQGVAGRWGGEEFIAFLPQTPIEQVIAFAEDIRRRFAAHRFFSHKDKFNCSVSIGVSYHDGEVELAAESLIQQADQRLYQVKNSGKNQVNY